MSEQNKLNESRREFLKKSIFAVASFGFVKNILGGAEALAKTAAKGASTNSAAAQGALPAGMSEISVSDPVAMAIGYMKDGEAAKVAYKKSHPEYKAPADIKKQNCASCALYNETSGGWGKCTMLTSGGVVSAKGWCGSWSKKS